MSSQGLNAAAFNSNSHYINVSPAAPAAGAGIPSGFRIQSSSDYTTQLNQKAIRYNQYDDRIVSFNQDRSISTRLKLKFARQICPGCADGPFPTKGSGNPESF